MNHNEHSMHTQKASSNFWKNTAILFCGGIILFFLLTEHRAHFFGALPYLLLLSCPLMHLFMHHDHGGHEHNKSQEGESK